MKKKFIERIAETHYVRSAIRDKADLSAFKKKLSFRELLGISAIGISYTICWPAIAGLGALSVYLKEPLWVAIGGPVLLVLSHLMFLAGMYLAGAEYSKIFLRWATRVAIEKLMGKSS